ncbi:MAG: nucleoside triphosphate pyrophosphatase [Bacillota bacterium]
MKLILASQSPRRKERLEDMGYKFEVRPADIDENLETYYDKSTLDNLKKTAPEELVKTLARKKAEKITLSKNEWVISCDTVVWQDGEIFEKPKDFADAKRMFLCYRGKYHQVISAYCIKSGDKEIVGFEKTKVKIKNMTESEIEEYINTFSPYDKAGGYGIQDGKVVEEIIGDYYNVFGFPQKIFDEIKFIERK